ncbi:MAG: diguanylate cyclase [Gammaproteobacteria bacterium]|uniref:diguanylate cyclase n=1 Tax=Marinobacter litoralis TaxID=187981 RepID=A0A3M2RDS5_9GAMM|nr:diguanylate cyclase [Marinobacter litoralis]MBR9872022.1 diguanylate cyclase [Gammaproteobacteria bacterium]RMJ03115.1 Response regulator PleD [Marinobacter litoralis]
MTTEAHDQLQKRLKLLQDRFVERAQSDVETLGRFARQIEQQQLSRLGLVECYQLLHRMAGSAGTFGLPKLGAAARSIENQLKPVVEARDRQTDSPDDPIALPADLAMQIHELTELVQKSDVQTKPETADEHSHQVEDAYEGSHGMQVQVMALAHDTGYLSGLMADLQGYGFACDLVSLSESRAAIENLKQRSGATILLCQDSDLADVLRFRTDHIEKNEHRRFPVVGIGRQNTFESLYRVAEQGATAYFSEPLDMPALAERIESLALERGSRPQGRVLIVDDDKELGERYCLVLNNAGMKTKLVSDPTKMMSALSAFEPDIVLMDVQLRAHSGVTLARMIRYEPRWLGLPIVYLSSEDNPEVQLDALAKGADEFLVKPVTDEYLVRSVRIRCYRARQLSDLMNRDSLTGLLKHSLIKQEVERELARCRRSGQFSCVVMLDLDHFKKVNDTWGHGQGDIVIRTLAHLLRNRLRESDTIGRYGGEEFLVVLSDCPIEQAEELIDDIRARFSELVFTSGDDSFQVTMSAGIAAINDFPLASEAIEAADQALYERKQAGRNGVTVYQRQDRDQDD